MEMGQLVEKTEEVERANECNEEVAECADMKHIRQDESDHGVNFGGEIVGLTFASC